MAEGKKGKGNGSDGEGDEAENLCSDGVDPLYALSVHASKAAKDAGGAPAKDAPAKDKLLLDATKDKPTDSLRVSLFFSFFVCRQAGML
jgi:hypothetical protein